MGGHLLADDGGGEVAGAVVSKVAVVPGEAETVILCPSCRLVLEPDEVPHSRQAPHPYVPVLSALVSPRSPPEVSTQETQLHLNEICIKCSMLIASIRSTLLAETDLIIR